MDCLPGDLIFYVAMPGAPLARRIVGAAELLLNWGAGKIQYGHVAVATGPQTLVEAVWPRVRTRPIDWSVTGLEVWRVPGVTSLQRSGAGLYADAHVGEHYGFQNYLFGYLPSWHSTICSMLAEDSWLSSRVDLAPDPSANETSPDALVAGGKLIKIYG